MSFFNLPWLLWVFVVGQGLSLVVVCSRLLTAVTSLVMRGLSSCDSQALELGLNSCGLQALVSHGIWNLHGPGIEPMSPALAGGFLSTVPPGKSKTSYHE